MESSATLKYLRSTARKARLVAAAVRGRSVADALVRLQYGSDRKVAVDLAKLLKSAVANMQSKNADAHVDVDGLRIKEIKVDNGPTMKRFRARAQGRGYPILKRMCHITVTVSS
jgi:large subunit ribosomal protein L22